MPSDARRHDYKRTQKKAVESVDSEDDSSTQARGPRTAKRPPRPSHGNIIIRGDVHIKNLNDLNLINGRRDESVPQRPSTPIRNPPRRSQASRATKQSSKQCDSPITSEEDVTSSPEETEPEEVVSRRPRKFTDSPQLPLLPSQKKKREQADEGYHTSGTVSAYTAQVPGKGKGKVKGKGKERSVSSNGGTARQPLLVSSGAGSKSKDNESESDASSCDGDHEEELSAGEDGQKVKDEHLEDETESDDDFLKLPIHIGNPNNLDAAGISEKAILDTGTKVDWLSQMFYDKIRDMGLGVKSTKLSQEELELQYRDFNGNKFQPKSKVDLTIQTEEFKGEMKCRTMRFFVASKATFTILFGRDTIRKHGIFVRSKRDTDGEGVLAGLHDDLTEAQKAEQKRQKKKQKTVSMERKKLREQKTEKLARQKENASTPSASKVAAHLATIVPRASKTHSSPMGSPRQSSSSMEGTW